MEEDQSPDFVAQALEVCALGGKRGLLCMCLVRRPLLAVHVVPY